MCRIYLEDFTQLELNNIEEAYNLIDEEYRKERFPTIHEYQEYVEGYREVIQTGVLYQYSADYKDDYTEYILVDNYEMCIRDRRMGRKDPNKMSKKTRNEWEDTFREEYRNAGASEAKANDTVNKTMDLVHKFHKAKN